MNIEINLSFFQSLVLKNQEQYERMFKIIEVHINDSQKKELDRIDNELKFFQNDTIKQSIKTLITKKRYQSKSYIQKTLSELKVLNQYEIYLLKFRFQFIKTILLSLIVIYGLLNFDYPKKEITYSTTDSSSNNISLFFKQNQIDLNKTALIVKYSSLFVGIERILLFLIVFVVVLLSSIFFLQYVIENQIKRVQDVIKKKQETLY